MKAYIMMGSLRKNGNTAQLLECLVAEMDEINVEHKTVWLKDKDISSCVACCACQNYHDGFGCPIKDDMHGIFEDILESDLIVIATPIYSWYCTAPVKIALDRLVYGMNKFYGAERGKALWQGKKLALLTTCGYSVGKGPDLWEEGMKRYTKHSKLEYLGMLAERDFGYKATFMDDAKAENARAFAREICG